MSKENDAPEMEMTATSAMNDKVTVVDTSMASNEAMAEPPPQSLETPPPAATEASELVVDGTIPPKAITKTESHDIAEELPKVPAACGGLWCLNLAEEEPVEAPYPAAMVRVLAETPAATVLVKTPVVETREAMIIIDTREAMVFVETPPVSEELPESVSEEPPDETLSPMPEPEPSSATDESVPRSEATPALADEPLKTIPVPPALEMPLSTQEEGSTVPGAVPEPPSSPTDAIMVPLGDADERATTKSSPPPAATPWWKNTKKLVCLVGVGVLLLVVLIIILVMVGGNNDNDDSSNGIDRDGLQSQSSAGTNPPLTLAPTPTVDPETAAPTITPLPSTAPSLSPNPTISFEPTESPSDKPSFKPSLKPSLTPTDEPSSKPSPPPTSIPTTSPTLSPTVQGNTGAPSPPPTDVPTATPTPVPTVATIPTTPPIAPTIQTKLLPYVLQGGNEFNDSTSYQSKALIRVEQQTGIEQMTDSKIVQYYALFCIYTATHAVPNAITDMDDRFEQLSVFPGWISKNGWTSNDIDPCPPTISDDEGNFDGIECQNGKVTAVKLNEKLLTGVFPSEVTLLASDGPYATGAGDLQTIDLYSNPFLFNNLDNSWMEFLGSSLAYLFFKATSFGGDLPRLPSGLVEFDCSYSLISGGLVNRNVQNLQNLVFFDVSGCAFNQKVPSVLGSLPKLKYLYLSDSFISGDLSYMRGMPSIIENWIDVNPDFGGTIPTFIGDLTTLRSFSVTQSNLVGTLPEELGNLFQMETLWLYGNRLTGTIPTVYGSGMPRIKAFRVESNQLFGTIPASICSKRTNAFPGGNLEVLGADYSRLANCNPDISGGCCNCKSIADCDAIVI